MKIHPREPELVLAISYRDRLICRDCDRPYRSTRAGFTKHFFCQLSRIKKKKEKFSQRETYSEEIRDEDKREENAGRWEGGRWWRRGNWFCITKPVVRDNERRSVSAHLLYELSNYIIIRRRPRSATRDATGGSLNSITRRFSRETKSSLLRRDPLPQDVPQ